MEGAPFGPVTVFHFTDSDPTDTISDFTATVNTGDNTLKSDVNPGNVRIVTDPNGGFDVQLSYTYAKELTGATFRVSVADNGGAMPVSASDTTFDVMPVLDTVILGKDGSLKEFDDSGSLVTISPAGTILSATSVLDGNGATVVYALTTGLEGAQFQNTVWEYTTRSGWTEMSSGFFQQISAATNSSGQPVVFGVIGQGEPGFANALFEQSSAFGPVGLDTGWQLLSAPGTVESISAITDHSGNDVVYAIWMGSNNLYEHSPAFSGNGWQQLSTGSFAQVSAGLNASGQAVSYSVLTNGQL